MGVGWDGGAAGRFQREWIYECIWLIHTVVNPAQYCKAGIFQIKKKIQKSRNITSGGEDVEKRNSRTLLVGM